MTLSEHTALSIPFSLAFYVVTGSVSLSFISALASILIDLDHVQDYFFETRKWSKPLGVFSHYRHQRFTKIYLLLHSWELTGILLFVGLYFEQNWLVALAIGFIFHIAMDTLCWCVIRSRITPFIYFFGFRLYNKFSSDLILNWNSRIIHKET